MIQIGIVGGAGYTAGELIRILLQHPFAKIAWIHSNSQAGKPIYSAHTDLLGETEVVFTDKLDFDAIQALFLCVGHNEAKVFLEKNFVPKTVKIIDLSQDFRLKNKNLIDRPFVYGLPELDKKSVQTAENIANPGCFATAIQLGLYPLAKANLLEDEVHINAITGSTGAGQKPTESTHFSWRNNNISIYKAFSHQHLGEITQSIVQLQANFSKNLHFIPVRGNFSRGIMATIYTKSNLSLEEAKSLYENYYLDSPFVFVSNENPDVKQVVNTNKGILYLEKHKDILLIVSMIDNLLKGASGQAVQNMNLMFGFEETAGLKLKAIGF